jgi:tetraacyldisaccharide 4'-kinase
MDITQYWQSINWLTLLLYPLSLLYQFVVFIRRLCYKFSCFKSHTFPVPIIIVGNITVGGNGKTPLIIYLLEEFKKKGYKPGVVSRGYGAINPDLDSGGCIIVDMTQTAKSQGDEPWMIANKTSCPVVIGRKRSHAVELLLKEFDCDIVLSDDGLQHYAMSRDIEICVVDTSKNFGNRLCLPAGPLREPESRLKEVDYIVYHQTNKLTNHTLSIAESSMTTSTTISTMQLTFDQCYHLTTHETIGLADLKQTTIHAIAGIASPQRFFIQLEQAGFKIIEHPFSDHYQYQLSDLEFNDSLPIIMTEKDAVKCNHFNLENCYYFSVKADVSENLIMNIIKKLSEQKTSLR